MRIALIFVSTLLLLVTLTLAAWALVPGLDDRVRNITLAERPPDGNYYLAHDRGGHVDHHVLYHGIDDEAIDHLKAADVLFVGTSRLMFALRSRILAPWALDHDLTYYALGFGFREGDAFALDLIRKYDLRPRLVVVNVDGFFNTDLSAWAEQVVRDTTFDAHKRFWEAEAGHEARRYLHRVLPNWIDVYGRPGFAAGNEFIAYRSRRNGVWSISPWPPPTMVAPAQDFVDEPIRDDLRASARAFKDELDARHTRMVLTYVPTPQHAGGNPVALGELLDVPVIGMDVDGLTSHDGSHLSEESALYWSRRLVEELTPHATAPR